MENGGIDTLATCDVLNALQQSNRCGFLDVVIAQAVPPLHDLKYRGKFFSSAGSKPLYEVAGKVAERDVVKRLLIWMAL